MFKKLLLLAAVALLGLGSANAQQTPEADGTYYLYNPTTGLFLSRGAGYGTAVWADNYGIPFKLIAKDSGFLIQWLDQTNQYVSDAYWSWADGGTDRAQTYIPTAVEGGYQLVTASHNEANLTLYINETAATEGFTHQVASNGKVGDNCNEGWNVWQFLSSAEREAIVAAKKTAAEAAVANQKGYTVTTTLADLVNDANSFAATDKTSSVTNATLATNYNGWTYSKTSGNNPGFQSNVGEVYEGSGTLTQQVTGLAAGIYKVTLHSFLRNGSNAACLANKNAGWTISNAYLEANGSQTMIADWASDRSSDSSPNDRSAARSLFDKGKYLNTVYCYVGDEGTLNITIAQPGAGVAVRWFTFANVTLTYYSDQVSDEDAEALLASVPTGMMNGEVLLALNTAKSTFETARTIANYNTLTTAIAAANTSISNYAAAKVYLDKASTLDEAGQASYAANETVATVQSAYDAGTFEALTAEQTAGMDAALRVAALAQTTVGADMTYAIVNAAGTAAVGADNWKIENALADGENFRLDTWAGTASGMAVPMIEYWHASGTNLSTNTISQTLSGLHKGIYRVTATTAVNNEQKVAPTAESALLFANAATTDITTGGTTTSHSGQTGTFSVEVKIDEDNSDLTLGIKTVDPNYNWIAFKDFKLEYIRVVTGKKLETITLSETSASLTVGDVLELTATVAPDDADEQTYTWASSNEAVATVVNGVVAALSEGTATITATATDGGGATGSATITVANAAAPAFYSTEIADATDYYIMNAATGKFLGGGNDWGTHASLIEHGIPFTITKEESGKYTLDSHVYNDADSHYFKGDYVDQTSKDNIYITSIEGGRFSISTAESAEYVTAGVGNTIVANNAADATNSLAQWYFVSKADRDKMLAAATAENPVDATYYIKEANISRNLRVSYGQSGWTNISYGEDKNQSNANYNAQVWNSTVDVYQDITGIPNGTYTLNMQGFSSGTDVKLYANNVEVDVLAKPDGITSQSAASTHFAAKECTNTLSVTVTDHTLRIGLSGDCTSAKWLCYDNFELYMTDYIPVTALSATIDAATINVTNTTNIQVTTTPEVVSFGVTYASSDESVATVDANGIVTGVGTGSATITIAGQMETSVTTTVNVEVSYDLAALSTALTTANTLNAKVANGVSSLASAITDAQGVYDAPESQAAIDAATSALEAVITTAEAIVTARLNLTGVAKKADALKGFLNTDISNDITDATAYAEDADATASEADNKANALNANFANWEEVEIANGTFDTASDWKESVSSSQNGTSEQVTNWTAKAGGWSSSASFAYGTAGTPNNGATVPEVDMYGKSEGGMLGFSLGWGNTTTYTQTIASLPVGKYVIYYEAYNSHNTSTIGANKIGLNETYSTAKDFGKNTWNAYATGVTVNAAVTDAVVSVGGQANSGSGVAGSAKFVIDNVTIYKYEGAATEAEFAALGAAITSAEGNTLGFEAGEYAPYNNAEALQLLAAAKAIDTTTPVLSSTVTEATAALEAATWTINDVEVNAIFDGSFETDYSGQNVNPIGWQRVKGAAADGYNVRYMGGNEAGLQATSSGKALFTKQSAYYGYAEGYTMPLKANTYYKVSFIYGGWGDCKKDGYVSIADPAGNAIVFSPTDLPVDATDADANVESWNTYEAIFKTGEAGDYVLGLRKKKCDTSGQSQYVYGDIQIFQVPVSEVTMRIRKANKYGTFVAPFDVVKPADVEVLTVTGLDDNTLVLEEVALVEGKIPANTPVIINKEDFEEEDSDFETKFYGQATSTEETVSDGHYLTGVLVDGIYAPKGSYVLQNQDGKVAFYLVGSDENQQPKMRVNSAYLTLLESSDAKSLSFGDDEATAIAGIEALTSGNMEGIYTTSGAKVNSLQKGVNIIRTKDGKSMKVYVK